MFLKLTSAHTGKKITVNVENISSYGDETRNVYAQDRGGVDTILGSYIIMGSGNQYSVKETPEQIENLLSSSYITIKQIHENRTTEVSKHTTNSLINDTEQLQSRSP